MTDCGDRRLRVLVEMIAVPDAPITSLPDWVASVCQVFGAMPLPTKRTERHPIRHVA